MQVITCDGTIATCLKGDSMHYCYSCHAYSCGNNYHQNCIARQIDNDGQSCPFCFLALDKDIPESSKRDEHRVGHSMYKDQIKHVLLYQESSKKGEVLQSYYWTNVLKIMKYGMNKWRKT